MYIIYSLLLLYSASQKSAVPLEKSRTMNISQILINEKTKKTVALIYMKSFKILNGRLCPKGYSIYYYCTNFDFFNDNTHFRHQYLIAFDNQAKNDLVYILCLKKLCSFKKVC